jgi:hypothetical protein
VSYGGAGRWATLNTATERLKDLAFADFNGDKKTDVFYKPANSRVWYVAYGGKGKWDTLNTSRAGLNELAFGDFDGDGKADVFHTPPDSREWLISYGGTGKWKPLGEAKERVKDLAFADFNGDGKTDVLYCAVPAPPKSPGNLRHTVTDNGVNLSWDDNSDSEDGYSLEINVTKRKPNGDFHSTEKYHHVIKKRDQQTLSLPFITPSNYIISRCVTITAFNRGGKSGPSNTVCIPSYR